LEGHRSKGQPKNTWRRDCEKERNGDSRFEVQLEEDEGGSTNQG